MTRIDLSIDNQLEESIKKLQSDLEEIKQRQLIGPDSLRPNIVSTESDYDVVSILDYLNMTGLYIVSMVAQFHADHQLNPYAAPYLEIFEMDGVTPFPWSDVDFYNVYTITREWLTDNLNIDNGIETMQILVNTIREAKIKVYVQASDSGTIELFNLI